MTTTVGWLVDKSALWRLSHPAVAESLRDRMASGRIGVSILTELEVGFSARSLADHEQVRNRLLDDLPPVPLPMRAEGRARDVQRQLIARGQHRAVSVPDLLLAATAEIEGLVVVHYDADFDMIADLTGQPTEWVVSRGSVP
ncbi:PIN domain nuclease [Nocardioides speluncae]|uniref:PIN domain nuclease n=1 Tax=Nocardioides speluncae TaxID=2670337 RepID=UPI0012B17B56|nr:PIN domain nuclease [Nocardioides speluncae]